MGRTASTSTVIFLFIAGWAGIALTIFHIGWLSAWALLEVPALSPPFADLRTVQAAQAAIASGLDPQVLNPGDPWHRPMNYPMIWVDLFRVFGGQSESAYYIFVGGMLAAYLLACLVLLKKYPSFWMLLCMFSGAGLLAVERGNNDLLVFAMLLMSAIAPTLFRGAIIFCASMLKIYPAFAIVSLLGTKRVVVIGVAVGLLLWGVIDFHELQKIRSSTPANAALSYGAASIALGIKNKAGIPISSWWISLALLTLSALLVFAKRIRADVLAWEHSQTESRLFLVGSSIYVLTFILSSNFDYRLIFLAFCVPYFLPIKNAIIRRWILGAMVLAGNQALMVKAIGVYGLALNIGVKCFLLIFIAAIGSVELFKASHASSRAKTENEGVHGLQMAGARINSRPQVAEHDVAA